MEPTNLQFNIGLPLQTDVVQFKQFLKEYGPHIGSVFFSLPLGVRHQTRKGIDTLFSDPKKVDLFWELLHLIQKQGIELELLLNAYTLTGEDVAAGASLLASHGITVDSVCLLDDLYEEVATHFPTAKKIYSYNNGIRSIEDFDKVNNNRRYDDYVIGSSCIRNNQLFRYIASKGKGVILLINNACSYNCGWCKQRGSCMNTFRANRKTHGVDYLYALQTVLPNELYDGTLDLSALSLLKFSNRTSNLNYTKNGLDSYMSGTMIPYLKKSKMNYSLYARMQGFWRWFPFLRLKKIKQYKEEILGHPVVFK